MELTPGTQIGPFEIKSPLGEGGMGIVYRARDTQLQRDVALKLLPDNFAKDADRLARFQREAQVLASLNHPNIAQIYGLEGSGASRCIVMELVEGKTLAEHVKHGSIPVDEALNIAKSICEALEAAHEKGVVHRDLKPANVKITPDGKVKVLDFGLAKAMESTSSNSTLSNSPTISMAATQAGVILGTAAYMSPEQARGRNVDQRSDVFSFGCVLYEMLTGRQAFQGDDVSDILASVLARDPDLTLLPPNLNPRIHELLRRCFDKNPKRRWQAVGDLRIEIENLLPNPTVEPIAIGTLPKRYKKQQWAGWAVAAAAVLALLVLSIGDLNRPESPETHLQVVTPPTSDGVSMAVSPDGRKLLFVASNQGRPQLFLRAFDSDNAQALPGTDGASYPFWSPDSRSVGFFASNRLKRIDVPDGAVQELATANNGRGGTWNPDGVILFASQTSGISRVSASGGPVAEVTRLLEISRTVGHAFPCFLPDGRHFLFYANGTQETRGVYWGDLESNEIVRLLDSDAAAVYSPSGHVLFVRQGTLFAHRFDPATRQLLGDPLPIAEQATINGAAGVAAVSAGNNLVAYRTGGLSGRQLVWLDRSGKESGVILPPSEFGLVNPELSPDGNRVALNRAIGGNSDIWLLEPARQITTRFTFDPEVDWAPVWSPDGSRIVFSSSRTGPSNLYWKLSSGAGSDELLLKSPQNMAPLDWSRDGRFIIYRTGHPQNGLDLWVLPLSGDRKPFPFIATPFNERDAQFSPDGRLVVYQSDESGRFEIYVQPFPGPGGKWQVSNAGGTQPRWRRDGQVLFYVGADATLMSASVETANGQTFKTSPPVALFATRLMEVTVFPKQQYAVSPDGQRFLVNVPSDRLPPITVVLNWNPGLKK